jgi:hypothetical protein
MKYVIMVAALMAATQANTDMSALKIEGFLSDSFTQLDEAAATTGSTAEAPATTDPAAEAPKEEAAAET